MRTYGSGETVRQTLPPGRLVPEDRCMMVRLVAVAAILHGTVHLFGFAVAVGLIDAGRLMDSLLLGGHLVLARDGGTAVAILLLGVGLGLFAAGAGLWSRRRWGMPLLINVAVIGMLVAGVAVHSTSGVLVGVALLALALLTERRTEGSGWVLRAGQPPPARR